MAPINIILVPFSKAIKRNVCNIDAFGHIRKNECAAAKMI
jgi:hypothetical protein